MSPPSASRRASFALLLCLAVAPAPAWGQDAGDADAPPAQAARPKGKWPWFKRYRKAATPPPAAATSPENVTELAPTPPAATPPAATPPAATPPAATPPDELSPAPPPSEVIARRRRARAQRAPSAAAAAEAPAPERAPIVLRAARVPSRGPAPRELRRLDAATRRELGLPAGTGAPDVAALSSAMDVLRDLQPLQLRVLSLTPGAPDEATVRSGFAAALLAHGLEGASAAESLLALHADPAHVPAWNNLATVLRRAGALGLAQDALDHALRLDAFSGIVHFNHAMLLEARGEHRDAEDAYVRALELDPSLWLPARNPLVVGNSAATRALHDLYMKRNAHGGVLVDTPAR